MTVTKLDSKSGCLLVGGRRVFPLGLSDPPPVNSTAPNGKPAWTEIASAGVNFGRNYTVWTAAAAGEQLLTVGQQLEAAQQHGLQMWVALAGLDNNLARKSLLNKIVNTLKAHPGLGVWKGADEPAHGHVPAAGLVAVRNHLKVIDPDHPIAIIQAPRAPAPKRGAPDRRLDDRRDQTVRGCLRHPRHRHLSHLQAAGQARGWAAGQHRHQRRRRHDPHRRSRNRPQSDLDDAADRLERSPAAAAPARLPHVPTSSLHGLRRDHRRRPRTLLLRRPPPTRDERARQATRLELELLEPCSPATAPRTQRRPTYRRVHRPARSTPGYRQRRRHRRQRPARHRRSST